MSDIAELLERCRKAAGPDRELDCQIAYAVDFGVDGMGNSFRDFCDVFERDWVEISRRAEMHQSILSHNLPRFTASIDSITALIEGELPGWHWLVERDLDGAFFGRVGSPQDGPFSWDAGPLSSAPLALCCAFLSAKLAQVTE